jgi:cysteine desulfurase
MEAYRTQGDHLITVATEHKAVLDTARRLEKSGCRLTVLGSGSDGRIDLEELEEAIWPETVLLSVMHANNEIGTMQPVHAIGEICRRKRVLFHCDAAQSVGKVPLNVAENGIDLLSMSAHKLYGPKGAGALFVRRGLRVAPQVDGGGHEAGMRSGTLNVPGIVGFGEACEIAAREMPEEAPRTVALRDRLQRAIVAGLEGVEVNGSLEHRIPGNLNLRFAGTDAEAILMSLPEVALSTGSACSSASVEPSHVLRAIGLSERDARSCVRFGLGRFTTEEEIDYTAQRVIEVVRKLRALSPVSPMAAG